MNPYSAPASSPRMVQGLGFIQSFQLTTSKLSGLLEGFQGMSDIWDCQSHLFAALILASMTGFDS